MPRIRRIQKKAENKKRRIIRKKIKSQKIAEARKFANLLDVRRMNREAIREMDKVIPRLSLPMIDAANYMQMLRTKFIVDRLKINIMQKRQVMKIIEINTFGMSIDASYLKNIKIKPSNVVKYFLKIKELMKLLRQKGKEGKKIQSLMKEVDKMILTWSSYKSDKLMVTPETYSLVHEIQPATMHKIALIIGETEYAKLVEALKEVGRTPI
ncbi:MAG: hypothetical protein Q7S21_06010 [archaeon]|nr:hypothetical protein [archaeon]